MTDKALSPLSSRDQGEIPVEVQRVVAALNKEAGFAETEWAIARSFLRDAADLIVSLARDLATVTAEKANQARIIAQFSDDLVAAEATILRLRTELDGLVSQCHELVQEIGTLREDEEVIRGLAHRLEQTLAAFTDPQSGPV